MRRLDISRMRTRIFAFTSELPSTSLCSCFCSWWLIFSRDACRWRCSGASMAANSASASRSSIRPPTTVLPTCSSAAGSGSAMTPPKASMWLRRYVAPMVPSTSASRQALSASMSCCFEKMRGRPAIGSSLSKRGASGLSVQFQPPMSRLPATATTIITSPNGTTTMSIAVPIAARRSAIAAGSVLAARSNCSAPARKLRSQPVSCGASATSTAPPAAIAPK